MLKRLVIITAVTLLGALLCNAQTPDSHKTDGMHNGRHWSALTYDQRIIFTEGYGEHVAFTNTTGCKESAGAEFPFAATLTEIVKGIDQIYNAPENASIPIIFAFNAFYLRLRGASDFDIAALLRSYRMVEHPAQPAKK